MTTPTEYTQLLQHQLANSSSMCFQLLDLQTSLLHALHQKLDTLPHVHEQMMQLHLYHEHLQVRILYSYKILNVLLLYVYRGIMNI